MILLCLAVALHDVNGPIRCTTGEKVRLAGIGALEMNGRARRGQPSVAGDPRTQRRAIAAVIGAKVAYEDRANNGSLWFAQPVPLRCEVAGRSRARLVAWCSGPRGDLSCGAIRARVAVRWPSYDRGRRLVDCAARR